MPSNLPLSIVVTEVIKHTPLWVWVLLVAITALGLRQWVEHRITRPRLLVASIALGGYSLWSAVQMYGPQALPAWALGSALAMATVAALRRPRRIRCEPDGSFTLDGSPWPLALMWTIFALRYAVAVTLVFHPDWAADMTFSSGVSLAYGALSGLFAARAWRILQAIPASIRLLPA